MTEEIVVTDKAKVAESLQARTRQDYDQLVGPGGVLVRILGFALATETELPSWGNPARDAKLREFAKTEPLLSGVLASAVSMAANRAWSITPRDYSDQMAIGLAKQYTDILNASWVQPSLRGFSGSGRLVAAGSSDYYSTDTGYVNELGRTGRRGPVTNLYYMDATCVTLSGDVDYPLTYWPSDPGGGDAYIKVPDKPLPMYIHIPDLTDGDERKYGLGYCAVSRAVVLAQIVRSLWTYDKQMLSNLPPIGAWLLGGISQMQFDEAFEAYESDQQGKDLTIYRQLLILANEDQAVTSVLEEFSRLPGEWQRDVVIDIYVSGLALIFGMDPREIWTRIGGGATKGEATIQHRKSMQKGLETFLLALQLQINTIMPESVIFKFDERDDAQDELRARVRRIRAEGRSIDIKHGVISRAEARELALRDGDITQAMFENGVPEIEILPSVGGGGRDPRTAGSVQVDEHLPGSFEKREEV